MNQPASNVTLKHPTGPWWTIYGTAGDIVQQIGQVFPHLTQNVGPTDFPAIVAQASAEWAQLVGATGSTPNQGNPGSQNFGNQNHGGTNGFGNQGGNYQGGGYTGGQGPGGGGQQGGGTPEPTHVPRPHCAHGEMLWKSGNRKADNKPYAFWTCQSSDRNNQCKPEFPPR